MKRFLRLAIVATLILSLVMMTACGDTFELKINKTSLTITEGNSETVTVTGVPSGQTATWRSSDEAIATVANGVVTAKKAGKCDITATVGGQSVKCSVTVAEKPITLSLDKPTASLERGLTLQLVLTGAPTGETVTWTSSNPAVATVANGLITAVSKGSATITAKVKTVETSCALTVTDSRTLTLSQTAVKLSYSDMTKEAVYESVQVTAKVGATDIAEIAWESEDEDIATVDGGVITAVSEGTTKIKASYDGLNANVDVTISEYIILDSTEAFTSIDEAVDSQYPGMSKNYILDGDLDFAGVDCYSLGYVGGGVFTPFNGVLNGNGYTLHNIVIRKKVDSTGLGLLYNAGIFSKIGSNGIIKNLSITGLELVVGTSSGAFGDTNLGLIENVFVNMKIDSSNADPTAAKVNGGLVFRNSGTINNSFVAVDHVGGISNVGAITHTNEGAINNSFAIARGTLGIAVNAGTQNNTKMLTAAEAITEGTYALWDKEIWNIEDGKIPYLGRGGQLDYNPNKETITLDVKATAEFPMGETMNILTKVSPVWIEGRVVWTSDATSIVTVSGGVLTAVANGYANVTATLGDTVKTCAVTVKYPTIALNKNFVKLGVCDIYSDTFTLNGVVGSFDESEPLAFTSSNTAIATVNATTGVITPVAAGEATITVVGKRDGKRAEGECKVAVVNYIKIGTVNEFRALNNAGSDLTFPGFGSDKMYILTSNIDFFGVNNFYSMGVKENNTRIRFEGVLNGNGYALMNLNLKKDPRTTNTNPDSGQLDAGLFHIIGENGLVKNLSLINIGINVNQMCGLLAGINYGLIENVYVSGTLKSTSNPNAKNAALVGINYASGVIKNAVVDFTLYPAGAGVALTPDLAIITNNFGTVKEVYTKCSANVATDAKAFVNFTTNSEDADVSNCEVKTDAEMKAAALYAKFDQAIWNIADTKIPYLKNTPDVNVAVEALDLGKTATTIFIGETETLKVAGHTQNIVWNTSEAGVVTVANGVLTPVAVGDALITATVDGKVGKCYVVVRAYTAFISTADQFYSIFVDPATHAPKAEAFASDKAYKLTANLDFAGKKFHALGVDQALTGAGGSLRGISFAGILDGDGYALMNITLTNHPNSGLTNAKFQGIFLGVTSTGIIRNLGVINMKMVDTDYSGVFGDVMQGVVENCFIDVDINASTVGGDNRRIAGIAINPNIAGARVENCFVQISTDLASYTAGVINDGKPGVLIAGNRVKKLTDLKGINRGAAGTQINNSFVAATSGTNTLLETAAASYEHFDESIWKVVEGKLPYLKNMGGFPTRA